MNNQEHKNNFKKLFNLNNILSQIINFAAYIVMVISLLVLVYLSFIDKFKIEIDLLTLGIFSIALVFLSWINWTTFYKRQYEKLMSEDIDQHDKGKYSIHARYYYAIKDWSDVELQKKIDSFNSEYEAKWLRWVEKTTGFPIESRDEVELDNEGRVVLDDDGNPKITKVTGIKDLPYKGFKYKYLMWQIKNHRYPQSGYKTSMELMSLFAFQDANLNKRNLKADKSFYRFHSVKKFTTTLMTVTLGASIIPEMITGNWGSAVLKLLLGITTISMSVIFGAINGIQGARLKLSTVEEACGDLERWSNSKPRLTPYTEKVKSEDGPKTNNEKTNNEKATEVITNIFNSNLQNK